MSKYPRTDAARLKDVCRHMAMAAECTRMEYELNEAKARIKRLEEAGNKLAGQHLFAVHTYDNAKKHVAEWYKAKEGNP